MGRRLADGSTLGGSWGESSVRAVGKQTWASSGGAVDVEGSAVPCSEGDSPADHEVASGSMDADLGGSLEVDAGSRMGTDASSPGGLVGMEIRVGAPCTGEEGSESGQVGDGLGLGRSGLLG